MLNIRKFRENFSSLVLVLPILLGGASAAKACCEISEEPRRIVHILTIEPKKIIDSPWNDKISIEVCQQWNLTKEEIEQFFTMSDEIDSYTYTEIYDTLPCYIDGTLKMEELIWDFTINGADKGAMKRKDGIGEEISLTCYARKCPPAAW